MPEGSISQAQVRRAVLRTYTTSQSSLSETSEAADVKIPIDSTDIEKHTQHLFGLSVNELEKSRRWKTTSYKDRHVFTLDERFAAALGVLKHFHPKRKSRVERMKPLAIIDALFIRHRCKKAFLNPDYGRKVIGLAHPLVSHGDSMRRLGRGIQ